MQTAARIERRYTASLGILVAITAALLVWSASIEVPQRETLDIFVQTGTAMPVIAVNHHARFQQALHDGARLVLVSGSQRIAVTASLHPEHGYQLQAQAPETLTLVLCAAPVSTTTGAAAYRLEINRPTRKLLSLFLPFERGQVP